MHSFHIYNTTAPELHKGRVVMPVGLPAKRVVSVCFEASKMSCGGVLLTTRLLPIHSPIRAAPVLSTAAADTLRSSSGRRRHSDPQLKMSLILQRVTHISELLTFKQHIHFDFSQI